MMQQKKSHQGPNCPLEECTHWLVKAILKKNGWPKSHSSAIPNAEIGMTPWKKLNNATLKADTTKGTLGNFYRSSADWIGPRMNISRPT